MLAHIIFRQENLNYDELYKDGRQDRSNCASFETSINKVHTIITESHMLSFLKKEMNIMENITTVKLNVLGVAGVMGSIIANYLGGWDLALQTLILFMAVDYITGLIVAGVFKKSGKTKHGALQSKAGFEGLCRKGMVLLIVLIAAQLDKLTGTEMIRDTVIIGYIVNELVSIAENMGLMGLPWPDVMKKALEMLKNKEDDK